MFDEFFSTAQQLTRQGQPFATAIVVRAEKPTSGKPGDKAIITADGVLHGWIGGSCAQPTVIKVALQALADGEPRLIRLSTDPELPTPREGLLELPMTCFSGGALEIYIEPQLPQPRLLIVGNLPTAQALAHLGKAMHYQILVVDPDHAGVGMPPGVELIHGDERENGLWQAMSAQINSLTYVIVATHGHYDELALEHALRSNAAYVGLVGSQRRGEAVKSYLRAQGIREERLNLLRCPAGLNIGARRGDEIALSIMAEIVQLRRSAEAIDYTVLLTPPPVPQPDEQPRQPQRAIDPVCKMKVVVNQAAYSLDYAGKRYYFCCAGCKQTFAQTPTAYIGLVALDSLTQSL